MSEGPDVSARFPPQEGQPPDEVRGGPEEVESASGLVKRQRVEHLRKRALEEEPEVQEATAISSRRKIRKQPPATSFSDLALVKHLKEEFARLARENPAEAEAWNRLGESLTSEEEFVKAFSEEEFVKAFNEHPHSIREEGYSPQLMQVAFCLFIVPVDRPAGFFSILDLLIRNVPSVTDFKDILYRIENSLVPEKFDLLTHAASLYGSIPVNRQSSEGIELLSLIPKEERAAAIPLIATLIAKTISDEQIAEINFIYKRVDINTRFENLSELSELLNSLPQAIPQGIPLEPFVETMTMLPQESRATVMPLIIALFRERSRDEQNGILFALRNIGAERAEAVLPIAARFLQSVSVTENYERVIYAINKVPAKQRAESLRWASQFCTRPIGGAGLAKIISAIRHLVPAERTNILSSALGLVQDVFYDEVPNIIRAVAAIPGGRDRARRVKQALPLLPFAKIDRGELLKTLESIDRREREEIVTLCLPLLRRTINGDDVSRFLNAVRDIPRVQRKELLGALENRLLALDPEERHWYLTAVAAVSPEQREQFLQRVDSILQGFAFDKEEFLESLNRIPPASRLAMLTEAQSFITGQQDGEEAGVILTSYANLLPETRAYLLQHVELFRGSSALMQAMAQIAPSEIEAIVAPTLPLFERLQNGSQRAIVLDAIRRADPDERAAMRTLIANVLRGVDNRTVDEFLETVRNLTASERHLILSHPEVQDYGSLERLILQTSWFRTTSASSPAGSAYEIHVVPEVLKETPWELLNTLAKDFRPDRTYLHVNYAGPSAPAVDAGGPGREFVSDLFTHLSEKLGFQEIGQSGLFRPTLNEPNFTFGATEKEIYHNIGRMMLFCLNASRNYPTGVIFDEGSFRAILGFSDKLLEQDFDALDHMKPEVFSELLAIFEKMNEQIPSELQAVSHMKRYLAPLPIDPEDKKEFLDAIYSVVEDEESVQALKIAKGTNLEPYNLEPYNLEPYLEQLQEALRQVILRTVLRPNLAPLHEMARGMKWAPFTNITWQKVHQFSPSGLSEQLQGVHSTKQIIDKLEMDAAIPEEKKQWLRNWIANTTDENRKRFLQAMTGSRALGKRHLAVRYVQDPLAPIYFHSCFNSVDFPFDTIVSEEQFGKTLEGHLKDLSYNRA